MNKKDILELRKHMKKENCSFSKMCGCYVNGEKNIILKFNETFLNLEEDEYFKYLDIAKKVISGTVGNNLLDLNFLPTENPNELNDKQVSLMALKKSSLKDETLLDEFYNSIIQNYDYTGNYLIILFSDSYDIIKKTKDNLKIDESEETYEYILCGICPVTLTEPGLRYFEEENKIKSLIRHWIVENPTNGFVFPAFTDRSSDVNSVIYYTKNAKITHPEIIESVLGCIDKKTATIEKETFKSVIKDSFADEKESDKAFMQIQDNLNSMIEEHNSIYEGTDEEPLSISEKEFENLLNESNINDELKEEFKKSYNENFLENPPLAEHLIDKRALKENDIRKKEESLIKEVLSLKDKLKSVEEEISLDSDDENKEPEDKDYNIILKVDEEKLPQIKSQIIDGKKYLIIPLEENEQTKINDLENLV